MYERIIKVMQTLPTYDYEIIYVDNASTDKSLQVYQGLVKQDSRVEVIRMSRNFGNSQPSFLAGIHNATGDAVVLLSGGLQDPPELIPSFIATWEQGFYVIYGIAKKRKDNSFIRRIGYKCFYRVFKTLSYLDIPLDSGDFSLMDRMVINIIKQLPEKDIYLRGLRTWAGFKQIGIEYKRENRLHGKSSNSFLANFWWAKKAIVNFSYKPLEYISRLAITAVGATFIAATIYLYWHFQYGAPRGFSTLLMVMFIFGSLQLLVLAVIGEYLIRMFHEIKNRPVYVIQEILKQDTINKNKTQTYFETPYRAPQDDRINLPAAVRGEEVHSTVSNHNEGISLTPQPQKQDNL